MQRSKKIVFVSHCLLNQNARSVGNEKSRGVVKELFDVISESGVGIVQLPCPQMSFNERLHWENKTKDSLDNKQYRNHCKNFSKTIISDIEKYLEKSYKVVGILGVELSATCAVHQIENGNRNSPGKGILVEELEEEMRKKRFQVPIIGINLNNPINSAEKLKNLLQC